MTNYHVVLSKRAIKELQKMDKFNSRVILSWISKNLENCSDPRSKGKQLKGNLSKFWRYRVGDYRILCEIREQEIIIIVVAIGHGREIYNG